MGKTGRGQRAFARLNVYDGCPPPFDRQQKFKIPAALKVTRSKPGRKVASLGWLCQELGWQYAGVVAKLEAKREANGKIYWDNKQKAVAKKAAAAKTAGIDAELAAMGY